jgi:hypothetical protein
MPRIYSLPPGDQRWWRYYQTVRTPIVRLIGDSLWWDVIEIIIPNAPKVTTSCRHVIGLRGMGQGIILIEKNALACETRKGGLEKMSRT